MEGHQRVFLQKLESRKLHVSTSPEPWATNPSYAVAPPISSAKLLSSLKSYMNVSIDSYPELGKQLSVHELASFHDP